MIADNEKFKLHLGKSEEVLAQYPDNYFDSVVCDPPYHLTSIVKRFGKQGSAPAQFGTDGAFARASKGFMGKEWDGGDIAFRPEFWTEVWRVLKPGGHLLAFSGSRTYHRMACGIEDAGFEIRDSTNWIYLSGFPKSHDVSKGIDKKAGAEREVTGHHERHTFAEWDSNCGNERDKTPAVRMDKPATEAAKQWQGWGTALKPSFEPICVARKPISEGSIAANVLKWGTGAINVDGCRIGDSGGTKDIPNGGGNKSNDVFGVYGACDTTSIDGLGRWPANTITTGMEFEWWAPYFYCAKASKEDRDEGLGGFEEKVAGGMSGRQDGSLDGPVVMGRNIHPTVKPTDLMRYLCRLVTPPGGLILDPFMGSGSTGKGAMLEGFRFVGIDMTPEYIEIARARIQYAYDQRYDLPALIRNEAKHSPQMSIFDVLPAAELPSYDTEEA